MRRMLARFWRAHHLRRAAVHADEAAMHTVEARRHKALAAWWQEQLQALRRAFADPAP